MTPTWSSRLRSKLLFVLLLVAAQAALAQGKSPRLSAADEQARQCQSMLNSLPVMKHPDMQAIYRKPGATIFDLLEALNVLAAGGNADAEYGVGRMFQHGICAEKDTNTSLAYLTQAAEHGSRAAQEVLASAYADGRNAPPVNRLDIEPDPIKAYAWYRVLGNEVHSEALRRRLTPPELAQAESLIQAQRERQAARKKQ